jgi:hypothetical protein
MGRRAVLIVVGVLAGCGAGIGAGFGPIDQAEAPAVPFPECAAETFAFVGETSLAALGLGEMSPPEAGRVGSIWVTAGPVDPEALGPAGGPQVVASRWICVEWEDGSGMAGPVDDGWQPPGAFTAGTTTDGPPIGPIVLVVGAVVIGAVSYVAFRRGAHRS